MPRVLLLPAVVCEPPKFGLPYLAIGRRPFGVDLVPVDVELLGDEHRHGGHHALPHLEHRQHDAHGVVGGDADPDVRLEHTGRLAQTAPATGRYPPSIRPPPAAAVVLRKTRLGAEQSWCAIMPTCDRR